MDLTKDSLFPFLSFPHLVPKFKVITDPAPPSSQRQNEFLWFCHAEPIRHCFCCLTAFPQSSGAHLLQMAYQGISPGNVPFLGRILVSAVKIKISTLYNFFFNSSVFSLEKTIISFIQQLYIACLFYAGHYCWSWEPSRELDTALALMEFQSQAGEMF